jgi:hypothetical protein
LKQNEAFPTFKVMICSRIPFKSNQLLQRNNVLDAAASNVDGFPWRDTCASSTQLNRMLWSKQSLSPSQNT